MKRLFDLCLAIVILPFALIICLPLLVVVALESRGNPLFLQTRVGRNQKPFTLMKLRTMYADTAHVGSHEVTRSQVTRIGHILRRLKLDELPQIINVALGQMSFVGPRPCLPSQEELVAARERLDVFTIRPGITGPAQLANLDMSQPQKLARADAEYITQQTLRADLRYIVQTAIGGGRGDATK